MKRSIMAAATAALGTLTLSACADPNFFHGAMPEAHGRAVNARQYRADIAACAEGPGQAWCRIAADDGNLGRMFPLDMKPLPKGMAYVYDPSQCEGTFEHGLCRGVARSRVAATPSCHGETIDGVCAGPVF